MYEERREKLFILTDISITSDQNITRNEVGNLSTYKNLEMATYNIKGYENINGSNK